MASGVVGAASLPAHDRSHADRHGDGGDLAVEDGDPSSRSVAEVTKCHVHATDGSISHVEHVRLDTPSWDVRRLVVETSNWWYNKHLLISPCAVKDINWPDRSIRIDITRPKVKASPPPWDPADIVDIAFERRLHDCYGWSGYCW